jgi:hypothetical protein
MHLGRREFIAGSAASAALAMSGGVQAKAADFGLGGPAGYFLSAANPVATRDQQELEALAIRLFARPDVTKAKQAAAAGLNMVTANTADAEAKGLFPGFVESYAFRSVLMAVNSDPEYPKVLRVYSPAGKWLGNETPQSRWGMENTDNAYRIIPLAGNARYVLKGRRMANPSAHVSYTLVGDTNTSVTLGLLEQTDLTTAPDGTFEITLDASPANGRKNHIQLTDEALYLFIRDAMNDWAETPNALRIERLDPPTRPPLSEDQLAARAARVMQMGVAPLYYWIRLVLNGQVATMHAPSLTGAAGGLLTQLSTHAWVDLADDEAYVITTDPVAAAYGSIMLYNVWGMTLEYRDHQSSLNGAQMVADSNGRYTFVVAHRDPGVKNWLDTTGIHQVSMGLRWQGVSPTNTKSPAIETRVVKLSEVERLTPGAARTTASERAGLLDERRKLFDRRFIDS